MTSPGDTTTRRGQCSLSNLCHGAVREQLDAEIFRSGEVGSGEKILARQSYLTLAICAGMADPLQDECVPTHQLKQKNEDVRHDNERSDRRQSH
jgi:hypothetical protein